MQKKTKKTDLRASSQRKVSSAKQPSGLIATAKTPTRSAGTKSALDNRSHRTAEAAWFHDEGGPSPALQLRSKRS